MPQKEDIKSVVLRLAEKKRRLKLLKKAQTGGKLTAAERAVVAEVVAEGANPVGGREYVLGEAAVKMLALEGKTIAEAERLLTTEDTKSTKKNQISFNKLFQKRPELKAAWERGRFLRALAELGETKLPIAEVEVELKKTQHLKSDSDLQKIFITDTESRDCFNQARHKHRIDVLDLIKNNLHKASPAALRIYQTLFNAEMAAPPADLTHITSKQIQEITGYVRQSVEYEWPKNYGLPRNSDGTYNLFKFVPWFEDFTKKKVPKASEPEALRNKKAEMLDIALKEKLGELLDRNSVLAGIMGRHQLMLNMFDKFIDKVPGLAENQPIERIRKILEDSFIEIRNEIAKSKIELKLNAEQQKKFEELIESL